MKASVFSEPGKLPELEEVLLADPGPDEVLVDIRAIGVCHTDLHAIRGELPVQSPIVLGHEGAGVVERVGERVTSVRPGDHVVLSVMPTCGVCRPCQRGKTHLCDGARPAIFGGTMLDGTLRLRRPDGQPVHHFFCQSSFAERAVVPARSAIPVRKDAPFDKIALLGCGTTTGVGAVIRAARVEPGDRVAIFGCGGVGLSAILAAAMVSAGAIIAVDVNERKLGLAREFGATHTIDSSRNDPVEEIRKVTGGGADYAFEFIGNPAVMEQAFESTAPGGHMYVVGGAPAGSKLSIDPLSLLFDKSIHGVVGGNLQAAVDVPLFVDLFMDGRLPLDRLVSRTVSLDGLGDAFTAMERGEVVRSVVVL